MQRLWKFRLYVEIEGEGKPYEIWSSAGNYGYGDESYKWIRFFELGDIYGEWLAGLLEDFENGLDKERGGVEYIKDGKFNPNFRRNDEDVWFGLEKIESLYFTIHKEFRLFDFGKGIKKKICTIGGKLNDVYRQTILENKNKILYG